MTPKLFDIAQNSLGYKGEISNQYHVARRVSPGNSKGMYRARFDSHLITMVLPIKIPLAMNVGTAGEFIYFPNARRMPENEISNLLGKVYHKRFVSEKESDLPVDFPTTV